MTHDLSRLGAWGDLSFFTTRWPALEARLLVEPDAALPPAHLRFAALERTPPDRTSVVILGQDPYPTPGHANGLAFSVAPDIRLPKSLANIYKELDTDVGGHPRNGDLGGWADQGVLLLNTALSTPPHDAGGHARLGWQDLTRQVLERLSDRARVFILWGNHARAHAGVLEQVGHHVLQSAHPSPLSAHRGFFGSRPFSRANAWLLANGQPPIDWSRDAA